MKKQLKLVVRDSVLVFLISYVTMIAYLGSRLTFSKIMALTIAALAPTMVVAAISKEIRMPSTTKPEEEATEYEFKKLA